MIRIIALTTVLLIISSNAAAEWIANGKNNITTQYANPSSIHKVRGTVQMIDLQDFSSQQLVGEVSGDMFLSAINLQEYDCKTKQSRLLYYSWFSKHMGKGKVVSTEKFSPLLEWKMIAPGSSNEILWKLACK